MTATAVAACQAPASARTLRRSTHAALSHGQRSAIAALAVTIESVVSESASTIPRGVGRSRVVTRSRIFGPRVPR